MNDLSIQSSRAYATAYAANEVKTQPAAPAAATTTTAASGQSSSDTVSISAEAKELFQQSSVDSDTSESGTSGGNTTQSSGLGGRPEDTPTSVTAPSTGTVGQLSSGLGGRPGG